MNIFKRIIDRINFNRQLKNSKNNLVEMPSYGEIYGTCVCRLEHVIYNNSEFYFYEYIYMNILELNKDTVNLLNEYYSILTIHGFKYIHKTIDNKVYILIYFNDDILGNLYLNEEAADTKLIRKLLSDIVHPSVKLDEYCSLDNNNIKEYGNIVCSLLNIIDAIHEGELLYLFDIFTYEELLSLSTVCCYFNDKDTRNTDIRVNALYKEVYHNDIHFYILNFLDLMIHLYYNESDILEDPDKECSIEKELITLFKTENYFKIENNYLYNKILEVIKHFIVNYNPDHLYDDIDEYID